MTTQDQIEKKIASLESRVEQLEVLIQNGGPETRLDTRKKLSIREFLLSTGISSDVQKTLAIGYYYEIHEGRPSFNAQDIKKGFHLAKESAPANVNDKINKNIQKGLMMETEDQIDNSKAWTLTNSGIDFISRILAPE